MGIGWGHKLMGVIFGNRANDSAVLIDLKDPAHQDKVGSALDLFHEKYAAFGPKHNAPEDVENLETQFGDQGFVRAIWDTQKQKITALTAGALLPDAEGKEFRTAVITYTAEENDNVSVAKQLVKDTLTALKDEHHIKAAFVELKPQDPKLEFLNDPESLESKVMRSLGAIPLPVQYVQPLEPDNDEQIEGLHPYVIFSNPNTGPQERAAIAVNHLEQMVRLYDPEIENPKNKANLENYKTSLERSVPLAEWMVKTASRPSSTILPDVF